MSEEPVIEDEADIIGEIIIPEEELDDDETEDEEEDDQNIQEEF